MYLDTTDIQERLRRDDKKALEVVYTTYQEAFVNFARKYPIGEEEVIDVYQDAVIALHQKFVSEQLVLTTASLKSYLFGIGKFMVLGKLKKQSRYQELPFEPERHEVATVEVEPPLTEEKKRLAIAFEKLSDSCQELLTLFYYRGYTMEDIVEARSYKDKNTAKSNKSRCLKKLVALIKDQ